MKLFVKSQTWINICYPYINVSHLLFDEKYSQIKTVFSSNFEMYFVYHNITTIRRKLNLRNLLLKTQHPLYYGFVFETEGILRQHVF